MRDDERLPLQPLEGGRSFPREPGRAWTIAQRMSATAVSYDVRFSAEEVHLLLHSLDHCLATCAKKAMRGQQVPCEHCDRTQILRRRLTRLFPSPDSR